MICCSTSFHVPKMPKPVLRWPMTMESLFVHAPKWWIFDCAVDVRSRFGLSGSLEDRLAALQWLYQWKTSGHWTCTVLSWTCLTLIWKMPTRGYQIQVYKHPPLETLDMLVCPYAWCSSQAFCLLALITSSTMPLQPVDALSESGAWQNQSCKLHKTRCCQNTVCCYRVWSKMMEIYWTLGPEFVFEFFLLYQILSLWRMYIHIVAQPNVRTDPT